MELFAQAASTSVLLISTSQVAGITGVSPCAQPLFMTFGENKSWHFKENISTI
jgi:hypothetical protein